MAFVGERLRILQVQPAKSREVTLVLEELDPAEGKLRVVARRELPTTSPSGLIRGGPVDPLLGFASWRDEKTWLLDPETLEIRATIDTARAFRLLDDDRLVYFRRDESGTLALNVAGESDARTLALPGRVPGATFTGELGWELEPGKLVVGLTRFGPGKTYEKTTHLVDLASGEWSEVARDVELRNSWWSRAEFSALPVGSLGTRLLQRDHGGGLLLLDPDGSVTPILEPKPAPWWLPDRR
ncbi:MAG: hypothetical protein P1V51_13040 [Deltaproteobacteria bacterium]|nr:hypothetical protein [Deltaproteobacteria bacterium]